MNQPGGSKDSWPGLKNVEVEPVGKAIVRDPHQFSVFEPYYKNVVALLKETRKGGVNTYTQADVTSRNWALNNIDRFFEPAGEMGPMAGRVIQLEFNRLAQSLSQPEREAKHDDLLAQALGVVAFPAASSYKKPENMGLAIVLENIKRKIVRELLPNISDQQAEDALGFGYTTKVIKSSATPAFFEDQ